MTKLRAFNFYKNGKFCEETSLPNMGEVLDPKLEPKVEISGAAITVFIKLVSLIFFYISFLK